MSVTTETKVGLLVLTAAVGLGWLTFQSGTIGANHFREDRRLLESRFDDVNGIIVGSKVKMSGVQIGEVVDIILNGDGYATVRLMVRQNVPLPSNVKAQIVSNGIIGEKFVTLITDYSPDGTLPETAIRIPSAGTASMEDIAQNFAKISEDLEKVAKSLRMSLGGEENAKKLGSIVNSINNVSSRLDDILNRELEQDKIKDIVNGMADFSTSLQQDGASILDDIKTSAQTLRTVLADNEAEAGQMIKNFGLASKNLATITAKLESGDSALGQLMMKDSTIVADLQVAAHDLKDIAGKINNGDGTLGRLINDPGTADKIDGALDSFADLSGRMEAFRTEVDFYGYGMTAEGVAKGRAEITFRPRPTRYYVVGATSDGLAAEADDTDGNTAYRGKDFGDDLKVTAQFGHIFQSVIWNQDLGFRIGIKENTFGVGADIDVPFWGHFIELAADAYDFSGTNNADGEENPHVDVTAKVNLVDQMLYAVGGYDNVFSQQYGSPFVGLGFRFQDDDLKYMVGQAL